jgi:glucose/arabinose dehydrogenase
VYVYYTTSETNVHNRVSRFTVTGNVASNEEKLIELPEVGGSAAHNGGAMHFGTDGKIYVAVGEAGIPANAPDLSIALGKILRFNDDGTIPSDNPFYGLHPGLPDAIWAYGLRNPFTFAVQPVTGRMHINDVGQQTWEEINLGAPGANYGWPSSEGPDNVSGGITGPLFTYKHSSDVTGPGGFFTGYCIVGGAFYADTGPFPLGYRNSYYFADYVNQFIGRFDWINNASYASAKVSGLPVDLLTGSDGALYLLTRDGITRFSAP